ncbi:hypothetical protein LCGC14_1687730, partial [marine sediment metagenome]
DLAQAEDWVTQGVIADVSGITTGLDELKQGLDRHKKLGSFIFSIPEDQCGKDTPARFIGKKTRHAGDYGMREKTMAASLAKEGFEASVEQCAFFLDMFHKKEPEIRDVYHKHIEQQLEDFRKLTTPGPIHRERFFMGLRPTGDNGNIYRDAYSYIPQSTVGDLTGLAILRIETWNFGVVIMDIHDQIILEVDDDMWSIHRALQLLAAGYNTELTFPNGLKFKIPNEFEIGYSKKGLTECGGCKDPGLENIVTTLRQHQKAQRTTTSGQPPLSSPQPSNAMSG